MNRPGGRRVLGVRIDDVDYDEAVAICRWLVSSAGTHQVVTVNPEFVMAARRDVEFATILEKADLAVPDGSGILWACRFAGKPLRQAVRGVDLTLRLAEEAAKNGWRVFLLGAAEGVADRTAEVLSARYPELMVAGTFAGESRLAGDAASTGAIRSAGPVDLLFVAFGHPAQEAWIARNAAKLGISLAIGVGGTFDYIAGVIPRSPKWVTDAGFEWLYRLVRQPWRWRRQLSLLGFVSHILVGSLRGGSAVESV